MVLLPLLRSLPASSGVSIVAALASATGVDFGVLRLGRPDTAADVLVASIMAFSIAVPVLWAGYMVSHAFRWLTAAIDDLRSWRHAKRGQSAQTADGTARHPRADTVAARSNEPVAGRTASIAGLQAPTAVPPE